jgi:CheY-like chemotaxis protein
VCRESFLSCTTFTNASPPMSVQRYTADILDETKNVLLDAGMNRVLPKPEPMHAFQAELRTMIQRAAASGNCSCRS